MRIAKALAFTVEFAVGVNCFTREPSFTRGQVGPHLPCLPTERQLMNMVIPPTECYVPRSFVHAVMLTSAMCSPMDPLRLGCGTVSIRRHSTSSAKATRNKLITMPVSAIWW